MMAQCIDAFTSSFSSFLSIVRPLEKAIRIHHVVSILIEAWASVAANRLRALLSVIGIVLGVSGYILMDSVTSTSKDQIAAAIRTVGANLLVVKSSGFDAVNRRFTEISVSDVKRIAEMPFVTQTAYASASVPMEVTWSALTMSANVTGIQNSFFEVRKWPLAKGSYFMSSDASSANRVAVLGSSTSRKLFGETNPVGSFVVIGQDKLRFRVVGVLQPKGYGITAADEDAVVFVPHSTFIRYFSSTFMQKIALVLIAVDDNSRVSEYTKAIMAAVQEGHPRANIQRDDISIQRADAFVKLATQADSTLTNMVYALMFLFMIVGGVGVMNIMLSSVSERRHEFGIRKAVGATNADIVTQVLLESVLLTFAGSVAGVLCSILFVATAIHGFGSTAHVSIEAVLVAASVSCGIGVCSGVVPAVIATQMSPIDALRK